jgi:protein SCO1/2
MKRRDMSAGIVAVGAVALLGGGLLYSNGFWRSDGGFSKCRTSSIAGGSAAIGGEFTLVDEAGKTVTEKDVFTRPSLVYFGYTFCPDVCPADTARNADAVDSLTERGYDVQPVFISIDPERDTPDVMAEFTEYLHPDMLGLTGSLVQVKTASQAYKTYFKKQPADDEFYFVDHSTFTYLVMPDTGFAEFFRRDVEAEKMADVVACFIDAA